MFYFATFFDQNYLSRGIALYDSLKEQSVEFTLFILCLDETPLLFFEENKINFPNIITLSLYEIEEADPELVIAKQNRTIIEYYFTLSPCLPLYLIKKHKLPHICTLDADILFFSTPTPLFNYLQDYSIIITPHKFSEELEELKVYGMYNVSFQIFKNDVWGLQCLQQWRSQCLAWCGDYFHEKTNQFADQKYLDTWILDFPRKVKVLNDNCTGIAPWNLNRYPLQYSNNKFNVNGTKLIYYHFQNFKIINHKLATNGFYIYKVKLSPSIKKLYFLYWKKIETVNSFLQIKKDVSKRMNLSQKLIIQILDEKKMFFKLHKYLIEVNSIFVPQIITRIVKKIYG